MKVAAICPNSSGQPGSEYIYDADTIEEARTRGWSHCCGSEYVGRIIALIKMPGDGSQGIKWQAGEELWAEGDDTHYLVDEICQLINEKLNIKAKISARHERLLFCPNSIGHFGRISVDPNMATVEFSMALANKGLSWELVDPKCFDKILSYVEEASKQGDFTW